MITVICPRDGTVFDALQHPWPPNAAELPPAYAWYAACPTDGEKVIVPLPTGPDGLQRWPGGKN